MCQAVGPGMCLVFLILDLKSQRPLYSVKEKLRGMRVSPMIEVSNHDRSVIGVDRFVAYAGLFQLEKKRSINNICKMACFFADA